MPNSFSPRSSRHTQPGTSTCNRQPAPASAFSCTTTMEIATQATKAACSQRWATTHFDSVTCIKTRAPQWCRVRPINISSAPPATKCSPVVPIVPFKIIVVQQSALDILRRIYKDSDHPDIATALSNVATTLNNLDRFSEALPLYQQALA